MNVKRFSVLCATSLSLTVPVYAAATGVDFLQFGIGARATGMGEAFAGVRSDAVSIHWNPAGLAGIRRIELGAMHGEAVIDASLSFFGLAYPLPHAGTLCVGGVFYVIEPMPATGMDGESLGDINWTDRALTLSYAADLADGLSGGVSGKLVQRIESDPYFGRAEGTAYAFDFGLLYRTPVRGLSAGGALLNSGTKLRMSGEKKEDVLPQTGRIGLAYERRQGETSTLLTADLHKVLAGLWHLNGGLEVGLQDVVFLRAGYLSKDGNVAGVTYGFGFLAGNLRIDYSNIPTSEMIGFTRNSRVSAVIHF